MEEEEGEYERMRLQRKNQQEEGSQQKNRGSKPLISTISKDPNKR